MTCTCTCVSRYHLSHIFLVSPTPGPGLIEWRTALVIVSMGTGKTGHCITEQGMARGGHYWISGRQQTVGMAAKCGSRLILKLRNIATIPAKHCVLVYNNNCSYKQNKIIAASHPGVW